jgi:hypothetical protein
MGPATSDRSTVRTASSIQKESKAGKNVKTCMLHACSCIGPSEPHRAYRKACTCIICVRSITVSVCISYPYSLVSLSCTFSIFSFCLCFCKASSLHGSILSLSLAIPPCLPSLFVSPQYCSTVASDH